MKRARLGWKIAAILFVLFVAVGLAAAIAGPRTSLATWLGHAGLAIAALGLVQYAFGWPRLPRLLWRVFGPLFSLVLVGTVARAVGWLGAYMTIRPRPVPVQLAAGLLILTLLAYVLIVVIPLFRLGEWKHLRGATPNGRLTELKDTFA